jgi:hypothetical protein
MLTREQMIEKWATHLSGKFSRFAFCETAGPGVADRTRGMVADIEKAVTSMVDEAIRESKNWDKPLAVVPAAQKRA